MSAETPPRTPSERLQAAEALLRQRVEAMPEAYRVPWHHALDYEFVTTDPSGLGFDVAHNARRPAVREWIATVDPAVGLLLADLLASFVPFVQTVEQQHDPDNPDRDSVVNAWWPGLLALADAVLAKGGEA